MGFYQLATIGLLSAGLMLGILTHVVAAEGLLWEDWDRRQVCAPGEYLVPETEEELADITLKGYAAKVGD